jgi:hypothetical protein
MKDEFDDLPAMKAITTPCLPYMPIDQKYLVGKKGKCITIYKSDQDKLWRDIEGTIYGFADGKSSDAVTRCGIGMLSLPTNSPCTLAAVAHDFSFTSPVYQLFHSRYEADQELERQLKLLGRWYSRPFYLLSRLFGRFFWENKDTRDKL